MKIQAKYFLVAILLIGSVGVWLPIGLELLIEKKVTLHNIPPNVTTYFVSLLFAGCIDFLLGKIRNLNVNGLASVFLNIILIGLLGIGIVLGSIILNIYRYDKLSLFISFLGVLISYRIWWIANDGNPNFINSSAPLGGDVNRPLSNA